MYSYISLKGPLILDGTEGSKLVKAFRNIPGVEIDGNLMKKRKAIASDLKAKKEKASKKNSGAPKCPPSAFFVFMEEFKKTYKENFSKNKSVAALALKLSSNVLSEFCTLDGIRSSLIRQENSIIYSLVERAQYCYNSNTYDPNAFLKDEFQGCLVEFIVRETEKLHAQVLFNGWLRIYRRQHKEQELMESEVVEEIIYGLESDILFGIASVISKMGFIFLEQGFSKLLVFLCISISICCSGSGFVYQVNQITDVFSCCNPI